jgi:hypothetical protein
MAMRRGLLVFGLASVFILSLTAQVDPQYQAWMRSMQPSLMAIRDANESSTAAEASTKMAETFDKVAGFWKARQKSDAVVFAETARDAARAIAAGEGDKTANLQKIQAQCGACHAVYRADNDPDRKIIRDGKVPAGWSVRPDRGTPDQLNFNIVGDIYRFEMGPAGTFYRADWNKSGDYQFSARLTQTKAPTHPISYGLMFGGTDLAGDSQTYSYFLVHNRGEYYIANREGNQKPVTVVNWTGHPAIVKEGSDGRQTNTLGVQVQGEDVFFTVNGTEVTRLPKSKLHTDGMYAFRIGHNLDVDVDQVIRAVILKQVER